MNEPFSKLLLLSTVVACVSWTVTKEEIFRELREWCQRCSAKSTKWYVCKMMYLPTCYYCFSHWVTLVLLSYVTFQPLEGLVGRAVGFFSVVAVSQVLLTGFNIYRAWLRGVQAWADRKEVK